MFKWIKRKIKEAKEERARKKLLDRLMEEMMIGTCCSMIARQRRGK